MLAEPMQAGDATQDLLIQPVTSQGSFRGEGSFQSWRCRALANQLLSAQQICARDPGLKFDLFAGGLQHRRQKTIVVPRVGRG